MSNKTHAFRALTCMCRSEYSLCEMHSEQLLHFYESQRNKRTETVTCTMGSIDFQVFKGNPPAHGLAFEGTRNDKADIQLLLKALGYKIG